VQLDQVFSLATRAVERVVEPLGGALCQAGHHEADIQTLGGGLDPRRYPPLTARHCRAGKDEAHGIGLAPSHQFGTGVMTIAAEGDPGGRPVVTNAPYQPPNMTAHLLPRRCLAGPQQAEPTGRGNRRRWIATGREVAVS
jgi:hypothetical protein